MKAPVLHLVAFFNGHNLSADPANAHDCWCEPIPRWQRNDHGVMVYVVEHEDYTAMHRSQQLAERAKGEPAQLAWIDHVLSGSFDYPTAVLRDIPAQKLLPPHPEKGQDDVSE